MNKPNLGVNAATVASAEDISCKKCGNEYFNSIFKLKRLSAVLSPTGQPTIVPMQVLSCTKCDEPLETMQ